MDLVPHMEWQETISCGLSQNCSYKWNNIQYGTIIFKKIVTFSSSENLIERRVLKKKSICIFGAGERSYNLTPGLEHQGRMVCDETGNLDHRLQVLYLLGQQGKQHVDQDL